MKQQEEENIKEEGVMLHRHTRQIGQSSKDEVKQRDLETELIQRERDGSKEKTTETGLMMMIEEKKKKQPVVQKSMMMKGRKQVMAMMRAMKRMRHRRCLQNLKG